MGRKAVTTEEWIAQARKIHGDTYDYSETTYVVRSEKLDVMCRIHGKFSTWPGSHLQGAGCRECFLDKGTAPLEEFISRSKLKFGDRFSYNDTVYTNAHAKTTITCINHGNFTIRARKHLYSPHGCPECSREAARSNIEEFTEKAQAVHGSKYNYDKVCYTTVDKKIEIRCNACLNYFYMTPNTHLSGCGCAVCAKTGFNTGSPISQFYIVSVTGDETFTGFGITSVMKHRFKVHRANVADAQCMMSSKFYIESTGSNVYDLERYVKSKFDCKQSQVSGFKTESSKELSPEDLAQICVAWMAENDLEYELVEEAA